MLSVITLVRWRSVLNVTGQRFEGLMIQNRHSRGLLLSTWSFGLQLYLEFEETYGKEFGWGILMVPLLVRGSVSHSLAPPAVQILSRSTFTFSVERETACCWRLAAQHLISTWCYAWLDFCPWGFCWKFHLSSYIFWLKIGFDKLQIELNIYQRCCIKFFLS